MSKKLLIVLACLLPLVTFAQTQVETNNSEIKQLRADIKILASEIAEMKTAVLSMKKNFDEARQKHSPVQEISIKLDNSSSDDYFSGSATAPVTIMEFFDFQCGFCAQFHKTVYQKIKQHYINNGKVKYIFRDFILDMHPQAAEAASYASCAGQQGFYPQMQDSLFDNPDMLAEGQLQDIASLVVGLDFSKFNKCLKSDDYKVSEIANHGNISKEAFGDFKEAEKLSVMGTPAFFIGKSSKPGQEMQGFFVRGDQDFDLFKNLIEELLR